MRLLRQFPAFVVLLMVGAALMLLPALHAAQLRQLAGGARLPRARGLLRRSSASSSASRR